MKKIFRSNYILVHSILMSVFSEDKYSNKLIEKEFKYNKKLGARDRKFIAENVYDIVRWWRKLVYVCGFNEGKQSSRELDQIICTWLVINEYSVPEYIKVNHNKLKNSYYKWNSSDLSFAIRHSFCDKVAKKLIDQFGDNAEEIAMELNQKAPIYLRVNTKNIAVDDLVVKLGREDIEVVKEKSVHTCLRLPIRANVFQSESFKNGDFEVQDKGSQVISDFLKVEPGMKVVDACAGAGGKTLHIADMMKNKGRIISLDIHQWKLNELKKRAKRNKVDNIETRFVEGSKSYKRLNGKMDRVLLDVPCTGFGVIKRNPDTKWKFDSERFNEILGQQKTILEQYSKLLAPGGSMVYSTCSIFKEENSDQVDQFLKNNPDWELDEEKTILPHQQNSDGFYMARLNRLN